MECENRDGLIDLDNEPDRSQARLRPIRIKLAGPWKRLGRTVGHEKRRGGGWGSHKGGEYSGD